MPEQEETITKTDLTNPKKMGKKLLHGMVNGGGGISQELLREGLTHIFPNANQAWISSLVQWLGFGLINGIVENAWIESFLSGAIGGSTKDLVKQIKEMFSSKVSSSKSLDKPTVNSVNGFIANMELQADAF